jgi:hypothetical protein
MQVIYFEFEVDESEVKETAEGMKQGTISVMVPFGVKIAKGNPVEATLNGKVLYCYVQKIEGNRMWFGEKNPIPN